jgi:hypothetical protein
VRLEQRKQRTCTTSLAAEALTSTPEMETTALTSEEAFGVLAPLVPAPST